MQFGTCEAEATHKSQWIFSGEEEKMKICNI